MPKNVEEKNFDKNVKYLVNQYFNLSSKSYLVFYSAYNIKNYNL